MSREKSPNRIPQLSPLLGLQRTSAPRLNVGSPAGYMLIGSDVKLNSPMSLVGQALAEILQYPERARDALRVLLHLVSGSAFHVTSCQKILSQLMTKVLAVKKKKSRKILLNY